MFFDDHSPPHFHLRYGEHEAVIRIHDLLVTDWHLPPSTLGLVIERAAKHRAALLRNWNAIETGRPMRNEEATGGQSAAKVVENPAKSTAKRRPAKTKKS